MNAEETQRRITQDDGGRDETVWVTDSGRCEVYHAMRLDADGRFEHRTRLYDVISQTHGALGPSLRSVELAAQHQWRTFSHRSGQYVWVREGDHVA